MARPVRYNMIGLLFCSSVVNYIDRVNISVAAPVIMAATNWDKDRFGLVFSAFLVGYALFQIPGGLVADRWSARKVLAGGGTWTLPFFVATGVGCVCTAILLVVPIRPIAFAGSAVPEGERQQAEA